MRQVVLDTETTGIHVEEGHRVIEIGCVEMIDRKLTGNYFHQYVNPERLIDAGALAVHGITNEFLKDKPLFKMIARDFINFISGAELIIHNAPFDIGFLNQELLTALSDKSTITSYCPVIDTLRLARQLHVGQRNSLDALCKRYAIDNSKRDFHGALLDAHLLARVYLAMTGGQGSFFETPHNHEVIDNSNATASISTVMEKHQLVVLKATIEELTEHEIYLQTMQAQGKCVWLESID
jgi:DNA polymerase III subunit epsilon